MDSRVGSSVVVYYHGQEIYHNECRIFDHASVFQAQIQGIDMVLEFVQNTVSWGRVCIFADSLSLLEALAAIKNSNPHVCRLKQKSLIILKTRQVDFQWVEAHVGVTGNERADVYAKQATAHPLVDLKIKNLFPPFKKKFVTNYYTNGKIDGSLQIKADKLLNFFPLVGLEPHIFNSKVMQEGETELTLDDNEVYPDFTLNEVEMCIGKMKRDKAPGEDGFTLGIIEEIFLADAAWFVEVLNLCFKLGKFLKIWKESRIVLIPKANKDLSNFESYRAICLLAIWGKVLDKLMTQILVAFLETNKLLDR
ncbi:hypothetical protein AVEN_84231-1 [Araneus ventricosus]|uniref:RNase H type-1 domain-containing protein n=1 Tax=Araneus ventricosus TaxID=182803 RepID=A0A4Y2L1B4_ARAVE|nr:hypothetical protein AVEN_84231-1 [Araneus ventricosus]